MRAAWTSSTGIMATIVLLCSTPISVSVCSRLSSRAPGTVLMIFAAFVSLVAASCSPSALTIRARFSADRFRFPGDRALHLLGDVDILDLDRIDLDSPFDRGIPKQLLEPVVDRGAVLEHEIEVALADRVAKRRFGSLNRRAAPILDRCHDLDRRVRTKPQDRVDPDRDAVASDRLLGFQLVGDDALIDPDDAVDERDQPIPARTLRLAEPAEAEQHAALIFLVDPEALAAT